MARPFIPRKCLEEKRVCYKYFAATRRSKEARSMHFELAEMGVDAESVC